MPTTTKSVSIDAPSRVSDPLDRTLALEALDRRLGQELDSVLAMDVEVDLADLRAQHPLQRQRGHLDHRHLAALLASRGGDLGADPTRADDHQALPALDSLGDPLRVGEGAQVVDAVELGAGNVEAAGPGAGRQQQPVVAESPIALEQQLLRPGLDPGHPGRGPKLDLVLAVEVGRVDVRLLGGLAAQVVLRQRRALVRSLGFVADQDQAAVEALLAQGLRRPLRRPGRLRRSRIADLWACVPP